MESDLDPDRMQALSQRDQLWASLRTLRPKIDELARGVFEDSQLERAIIGLLARIIQAELDFRDRP